jgi:hypothetical protein
MVVLDDSSVGRLMGFVEQGCGLYGKSLENGTKVVTGVSAPPECCDG